MAGIDFKKFYESGIDIEIFSELLTTSGLVLNENVKWITFHGSYDFAYLIKSLSNMQLPIEENGFNELLNLYFDTYYDVRQMIKNISWLKGSLSRISNDLDIKRIGQTHQAGSDSLITSKVFFKLLANFNEQLDLFGDKNKLFGFAYKINDDYDGYNNFNGNFSSYNQLHSFMGLNGMGINNINNVNNMNNINNINTMNNINNNSPNVNVNNPLTTSKLSLNKTHNNNNIPNMLYFQNMNMNNLNGYSGFNPNNNVSNMNNLNNMNMFYPNSSNIPNFNNMYQQPMDYNYYPNNNFYNNNTNTNITNTGFKGINPNTNLNNNSTTNNSGMKESKFISQN
jgi:CCR4-NOT transcription complex subunit 7/8